MRLSTLGYLYARRLRTHPVQELLAGLGIAVGVALVFAVQVATSSTAEGSGQIVHRVLGRADLQLRARDERGIDEALASRVSSLPGVLRVVRGIELTATAMGPSGRPVILQLVSGALAPNSTIGLARDPLAQLGGRDVVLPRATAVALGVDQSADASGAVTPSRITLQVRGRDYPVRVGVILGPEAGGPLAAALAAFAPLRLLQRAAGLQGRITGVLVQSRAGAHREVRRELERIAPRGVSVAAADEDIRLLRQATAPNRQATGFFALVAALVGLLLAFNAMLLSIPERRRVVADLRIQGTRRFDIARLLLFQAVCLGLAASLAGVLLGDVLSRAIFRETPGYLAAAFPLGTQTVVGWQPALLSIAGGVVAACLASLPPLLDLRRSRALDAVRFMSGEPGQGVSVRLRLWLFGAAASLCLASVLLPRILDARWQVAAIIALALATLLVIPLAFAGAVAGAQALALRSDHLNLLLLATRTLRATTVRSLALAATAAIAVFGTVAAEGAHTDLLTGLYRDYAQYAASADIWVTNPNDYLTTRSLPADALAAELGRVPQVAAVRPYYGGFLDVAGHRAWLIARAPAALGGFPAGQLVSGERRITSMRLREGGWVTLTAQLADALRAHVGGPVTLPTPSGPALYRLAATTTNLGWSAGAIVLNSSDYRRAWPGTQPTALEVQVAPGAKQAAVSAAIEGRLGGDSALTVEGHLARAAKADPLAREGLARLSQISLLLTVAAALAIAAAMAASVWQRRASLASLRLQSFSPRQLRVIILYEAALVIGTGCIAGAASGVWAHAQIDRYLRLVSGFPAPFAPAIGQSLGQLVIIVAATLLALGMLGIFASDPPPRLALAEPS
jgi:putative ABC transport system permease protein